MTRRLVAVVPPAVSGPQEFPSSELRLAMVEDVYEMVASLELVEPVLVVFEGSADADALRGFTWPGTLVLSVSPAASSVDVLVELGKRGAEEAVLIAGDAPDLPSLLVGKLHRGLGSAQVALLPASGGGLVGLATSCPPPAWLLSSGAGLDINRAHTAVVEAAPRRGAVSVGPGWHRIRHPDDLPRLDPGLEGWEVTRAVLHAQGNGAPVG